MHRPLPPETVTDSLRAIFMPAPEVCDFVNAHILEDGGTLYNPDHEHLLHANIGFLWTNTECTRKGKRIAGMAEIPMFMCHKWQKARQEIQIMDWFNGRIPDFMITLDAQYCAQCSDIEFCMLVEHELSHCAQEKDVHGAPKFSRDTGLPKFTLAPHDVEEFVGVVERYGVGDPEGGIARMVEAANKGPTVGKTSIAQACGTCLGRAA